MTIDPAALRIFCSGFDTMNFRASDLQRRMPIEPARLQMLVKRHFPGMAGDAAGGRRNYTARMAGMLAIANSLMNAGLGMGISAQVADTAIGIIEELIEKVGGGDDPALDELLATTFYLLPSRLIGDDPKIIIGGEPPATDAAHVTLPIGRIVATIAANLVAERKVLIERAAPAADAA